MISIVKSPPLSHHPTNNHRRSLHTHFKLVCFFNGGFSSADDPLRYTGGDTKLVYVDRPVTFSKLVSKINSISSSVLSSSFVLGYRLGSASPISRLSSDEDVRRAVDAFDKLHSCGMSARFKLYVCKPNGEVGSGHRVGSETRIPLEDVKIHEQQGRRIVLKQPGQKPGLDSGPGRKPGLDAGSGRKPGPGFEGMKCDIVAKYNRFYVNDVNFKVDRDLGLRVLRNGGVDRSQLAAMKSLKPGSNGFRDKNDRSSIGNVNGESIRVSSGNHSLEKNGANDQCGGESGNSRELSLKPGSNGFRVKKDSGIGDVNGENIISRGGNVSLVKNGQNYCQCCGESGHPSELLSLKPGSNGLCDKKDSGIDDVNGESIILVKNGQNCHGSGESVPVIPSESVSGELSTSIRNIRFSVKDDARSEQQCVPIRVSPNTEGAFGNKLAGEETAIDSLGKSQNGGTNDLLVVKQVEDPQLSSRAECVVTSKQMDIMDVGQSISSSLVKELNAVASNPSLQDSAKMEKQSESDKKDREVSPSSLCSAEQVNHGQSLSSSKVIGGASNDLAAFYTNLATRELQSIKNSDLEFIKELGSGTYGTVYHGKWKGSNVAIKKINPGCFTDGALEDKLLGDFWKEAHILGQLHHPNIVAFYGVVKDGPVKNLASVTEYMVNGSLRQVLRRKDRTIDRRKRMILAMDAAFGMEYLHEKGIVHFDLKSHNFLVNMKDPRRPVCKIGDLGLSKIKQRTLVSGGVRGTVPWMAPELLNFNRKNNLVTDKVDVYSFGIVMWELLTGEEPYANLRSEEIIGGIINGNLRPEIPSWCDPTWRSLMERCWSSDPESRPPFSEISKELRAMSAAMNIE